MADWISVREAANLSAYNLQHIRRLICGGQIRADRKGLCGGLIVSPCWTIWQKLANHRTNDEDLTQIGLWPLPRLTPLHDNTHRTGWPANGVRHANQGIPANLCCHPH